MMRQALSYVRFSQQSQGDGDSYRRQVAEVEAVCARMGWNLVRKFEDLGVSAWLGKNRKRNLGVFLKGVEEGIWPAGSVLIVEALDRLSRDVPLKVIRLMEDVIRGGIAIYTMEDGILYDVDKIDNDQSCLFVVLGKLMRGRDESKVKSLRTKSWMENKKSKGEKHTGRTPWWIDSKTMELKYPHVSIVKRIYELALMGYGTTAIAGAINHEFIDFEKKFSLSAVDNVLRSKSATGVLSICKDREEIESIEGYYPSVVSMDDWMRAKLVRVKNLRAPGRKNKAVGTIFSSKLKCAGCGSALRFCGIGSKSYLKCQNAVAKMGCPAEIAHYDDFEKGLLWLIESKTNKLGIIQIDNHRERIAIEGKLSVIEDEINNLAEGMAFIRDAGVRAGMADKINAKSLIADGLKSDLVKLAPVVKIGGGGHRRFNLGMDKLNALSGEALIESRTKNKLIISEVVDFIKVSIATEFNEERGWVRRVVMKLNGSSDEYEYLLRTRPKRAYKKKDRVNKLGTPL